VTASRETLHPDTDMDGSAVKTCGWNTAFLGRIEHCAEKALIKLSNGVDIRFRAPSHHPATAVAGNAPNG
jgi:hypothetical protein